MVSLVRVARLCKILSLSDRERFLLYVRLKDRGWHTPCWIWQGGLDDKGYARIGIAGRKQSAHRAAWEIFCGPIEPAMQIDHLCRNRDCVNPEHLEPVTSKINVQRAVPFRPSYSDDFCPRGHPRTAENARFEAGGKRRCYPCLKIKWAAEEERRRAQRRVADRPASRPVSAPGISGGGVSGEVHPADLVRLSHGGTGYNS